MYLLAIKLSLLKHTIDDASPLLSELEALPSKIEEVLKEKERIQWFAAKFAHIRDAFFLGRGIDYAASMEGSLKMKEISYIHSESYAAGEMKHGTISLIEDQTLVIGVITQKDLFEKTLSNMVETGSRGAYLAAITQSGCYSIEDNVNFTVYIPRVNEAFSASLTVIPMQLLGYYMAVARGLDVDKPRNLAKSVTVE
jgi:glucosamine--fructose-6-phosphate aminotransferase (isomerizing)